MIGYHGSDKTITTIHTGTGAGLYITPDHAAAHAYAYATAHKANSTGTPTVHTLTLADTANIATYWDADPIIDEAAEHPATGFDRDDYSYWALIEMTEIRDALAEAGYDGIHLDDTTPDGDDHTSILVWNTELLTITHVITLTAA